MSPPSNSESNPTQTWKGEARAKLLGSAPAGAAEAKSSPGRASRRPTRGGWRPLPSSSTGGSSPGGG